MNFYISETNNNNLPGSGQSLLAKYDYKKNDNSPLGQELTIAKKEQLK